MTTPRWTIRLRLTMLFGALFLAAGAALLFVTYLLVVHALPGLDVDPPSPPAIEVQGGLPAPEVPAPDTDLQRRLAEQRAEDLRQFRVASGIGLVLMAFVSAGLAWLMAGRVLRPLRAMAVTANDISSRSLHQRLAMKGPRDEIKDLADTFDGLLARLEHAFEAQRRFVANASHELRSPLTFERSLLEVALSDPDPAALRAACERLLVNNEHQETIIEALLTLARSQRGLERREPVDLAAVAETVVRTAEPRDLRVLTDLTPTVTAGDAPLIERLIKNLVDNAIRHNVDNGEVHIWAGQSNSRPSIRVTNTGPIIPPNQVDDLLQPFRRLDTTRIQNQYGVGLGLSIVAAITTAHNATLTTTPNPTGGLTVLVEFARPSPL
ncbi:ATP-binding protein [Kribbella sp. NPDC023855]|uniref:sensor histidine kinase n=1 Tax=Kribbella sp. NPDC023855 TaxID=3154698 RepID=UPI0033C98320